MLDCLPVPQLITGKLRHGARYQPAAGTREHMDYQDYDYESHELLQDAVDKGMIEEGSAAHGVAKQCIDKGYASLSPAQKATYDRHVAPHLETLAERRDVAERMRGMPD
jgi:hypothetical protein